MSLNQRSPTVGGTPSLWHQTHTPQTILPKTPVYLELATESASHQEFDTAEKLRRAQEELRWHRMMYDNIPTIYFSLDATGLILSVNDFGADCLGYTPEQLLQQPIVQLFAQSDQQRLSNAFISLCKTAPDDAVSYGNFLLNNPVNGIKAVRITLRLILDEEKSSIKKSTILMLCEAITSLEPAEASSEDADNLVKNLPELPSNQGQRKELESLSHLQEEFFSTVSHELRTPLTNMKMAIQMLGITLHREHNLFSATKKPTNEGSKAACYFNILENECDRQINLINNFLELQRLDTNAKPWVLETIHIQQWLWRIVEEFKTRNFDICRQKLHISVSPSLATLTSNPCSLERILIELLTNACKFSPPEGEITVTAQIKSQNIVLQVINSDVEIPQSELPHIFDKFYRIPSNDPGKQGGTGLGLALVQKLIKQLGGTIEVESGSNRTCFSIQLVLQQPKIVE
ncbi:PAS/PAC sensor signal transduction histidine kinase [Trichormus variabilis ATCC 29413]|uniref:histidine kinase n=2 Tax=Anabaena variabilis TaxID=264691 RepID=Q3MGA5_TRIV2|nr:MULTISPECIES: ATP-binding protein [Nostocaceae]ABA19981.1 PAS/PAC sensor signal transduction histidine kinase [Trichormus variabilis ATCC 29413]MBC1216437.1 PAS domain-containing sensor histidine kinase [Trichormus variabilis ARAD]MBC1256972.1 PAS domain-containing sensor histidine kinase [Trichormus variabilis V5]MBC1268425.1 PAS domain-containing sensor histidine kinase [Trichormus variabilis FSR]MBC1305207.1 PAS domain-containing sensor histidine kinase [Trichormus variabilis N2B]